MSVVEQVLVRFGDRVLRFTAWCVAAACIFLGSWPTGAWSAQDEALAGATHTQLIDGRWLTLGGKSASHVPLADAKVASPDGKARPFQVQLLQARYGHSATNLPDGRVLVFGGIGVDNDPVAQSEVFDPVVGTFQSLGDLGLIPRAFHTVTVLVDGRVLITGGVDGKRVPLYEAEIWNPADMRVERFNVRIERARLKHLAALLPTNTVVLWGGIDGNGAAVEHAETFDVREQRFRVEPLSVVQKRLADLEGPQPPAVQIVAPEADSRGVPVDRPIAVLFNKRMAVESLSASTVTLIGPEGVESVTVAPVEQGILLFVRPRRDLLPGSRYTLFIKDALDKQGQLLPLFATAFDTEALGSSGRGEVVAVQGAAASAAGVRDLRDSKALGATGAHDPQGVPPGFDDDDVWTPTAANRSGKWFSGWATRAYAFPPKSAALRERLYGAHELQVQILTKRAEALGMEVPPGAPLGAGRRATGPTAEDSEFEQHNGSNARTGRRYARLTWADIQETSKQAANESAASGQAGSTSVEGQVLRLNGRPLGNVMVRIDGISTRTDENGEFRLMGVASGEKLLIIDGRPANRPTASYGRYEYGMKVSEGKVNLVPFVIWMARLDTENFAALDSPTLRDVVVTHPNMPGFELRIPAGTVIRDADGNIVNRIGITPVPADQPAVPIPYIGISINFTLQPGGATLHGVDGKPRAAILKYPNYSGEPAGTPVSLVDYDPKGRGWYRYGQGAVSSDSKSIQSAEDFKLYQFASTMYIGDLGAGSPTSNTPPCDTPGPGQSQGRGSWSQNADAGGGTCTFGGDPVALHSGVFHHSERDLLIPDVTPIEVIRISRDKDADLNNNNILTAFRRPFGFGTSHNYNIYLYSTADSFNSLYVVMPNGRGVFFTNPVSQNSWGGTFYSTEASGEFAGAIVQSYTLYLRDGRKWGFGSYPSARILWMEDRNGNRTLVNRVGGYSGGEVSEIVSPNGRRVYFTYNTGLAITSMRDDLGRTYTYTYDPAGRLQEVIAPDNTRRTYIWGGGDPFHTVSRVTDPNGNAYVVNNGGSQMLADGSTFQYVYSYDSRKKKYYTNVTDRRGAVRRVGMTGGPGTAIWVDENIEAYGNALQRTTTYTYAPWGSGGGLRLTAQTDPLGRVTAFEYDTAGNLTKQTWLSGTANAVSVQTTYDPVFNQPLTIRGPMGHTTTFDYDTLGRVTRIRDPLLNATLFDYDTQGRVIEVTDPLLRKTRFTYEGADLTTVTDTLNRTTRIRTDVVGRAMATIDPAGKTTEQFWDAMNRLVRIVDPTGGNTDFSYDFNGNLLTQKDAKLNTTTFTYNPIGKRASMRDALNALETTLYEPGGLLSRRTDRKGQVSGVTYDILGRVKTIGFGATAAAPTTYKSTVTLTWDKGDRLTQIVDSKSGTITRSYDGRDRLIKEVTPQGEVSYTYDTAGRKTSMIIKNKQVVQPTITYSWDDANRLTRISQAAGSINGSVAQVIDFVYDAASQLKRTVLANRSTIDYGYDDAGQLASIMHRKADASLIGDLIYAYDAAGRRTGATGSLARLALPAADVLDASYNANNQLLTWRGKGYSYDPNGNLSFDGTSTYQWDERDRLTGILTGASTTAGFSYDSLGRRYGKTVAGTTTGFVYGGLEPANFAQELAGTTNTSALKATILSAGIDQTLARMTGASATAQVSSFMADGNNNTWRISDKNQNKLSDYTYEPYGTASVDVPNTNSQEFTGRENERLGGEGLMYYRARYYMPGCGRFISEDPIGWASGQTNDYAYVRGRPVDRIDPSGQAGLLSVLAIVGGAAYAAYQGYQAGLDYRDAQCATDRRFDARRSNEDVYTPAQEVAREFEGFSNGIQAYGPFALRATVGVAIAGVGGGAPGAFIAAAAGAIGVHVGASGSCR